MQFHPLFCRPVLARRRRLSFRNGKGGQLQVSVIKPQLPLYRHVHPLLDPLQDGFCRPVFHKFRHSDGIGVVRHMKPHHPGIALFQLPVVHRKHLAGDHHPAQVQADLPHGDHFPADGFSVDHPHHGLGLPPGFANSRPVLQRFSHSLLAQRLGPREHRFRAVRNLLTGQRELLRRSFFRKRDLLFGPRVCWRRRYFPLRLTGKNRSSQSVGAANGTFQLLQRLFCRGNCK